MKKTVVGSAVGAALVIWMVADPLSLAGLVKALAGGVVTFVKSLVS